MDPTTTAAAAATITRNADGTAANAIPPAPHLPGPFIATPSIPNLRDAGAPFAAQRIRPRTLLRSADPSRADADALRVLRRLRVRKIFDLRSAPEIRGAGGAREGWGEEKEEEEEGGGGSVERVWCPVFEEGYYSEERVRGRYRLYASGGTEGFVEAYAAILEQGSTAFRTIFRHIATLTSAEQPEAFLVHCTAGKDRTGVFVALLLSMLGVEDEPIADEYALTDVGLAHLKPMFLKKLLENPAFENDKEGPERMLGSRKENMLAFLLKLREKYESAENYIRTVCGLTTEEVERIRQVMTLPEQANKEKGEEKPAL